MIWTHGMRCEKRCRIGQNTCGWSLRPIMKRLSSISNSLVNSKMAWSCITLTSQWFILTQTDTWNGILKTYCQWLSRTTSNYILTSLDGLGLGCLMTYGDIDARTCHGLQAVYVFNYVTSKALAPIFIDVRSSSLHCLVATDATFFANKLDGLVYDIDFVHFISPLVLETFVTQEIVPISLNVSSLATTCLWNNHFNQKTSTKISTDW